MHTCEGEWCGVCGGYGQLAEGLGTGVFCSPTPVYRRVCVDVHEGTGGEGGGGGSSAKKDERPLDIIEVYYIVRRM